MIVTDVASREKEGRELVEIIKNEGKKDGSNADAEFYVLDVTNEKQWHDVIEQAEKRFGQPLDVAFLNAGVGGEPSVSLTFGGRLHGSMPEGVL